MYILCFMRVIYTEHLNCSTLKHNIIRARNSKKI